MMGLSKFAIMVSEDVNHENSKIIELFNKILNNMFKFILVVGIPYFIYLLSQFTANF